jgi:arsenate reductase (thioredoxin)
MDKMPKVLFLSRGNASRALMAEGFFRALAGDRFIPISAGTENASVNPVVTEVMSEAGIDISTQKPHEIASLFRENFHYVVALCDESRERYPLYPFTPNLLKRSVPDPIVGTGEPETRKQASREVRDQVRKMVEKLIETMNTPGVAFTKAHALAA